MGLPDVAHHVIGCRLLKKRGLKIRWMTWRAISGCLWMKDGLALQTGASFIAGIVAALTSNPIDLAKSRLMSMKPDANGNMPYNGTLDCILKTVRQEGIGSVYKGLVPTIARQVPLNVVRPRAPQGTRHHTSSLCRTERLCEPRDTR